MPEELEAVNDEDDVSVRHLVTPERLQYLGLRLVGYKKRRLQRSTQRVNFKRFLGFFGLSPVSVTEVYHDMQKLGIEEARMEGSRLDLRNLLITLHYLLKYPTYVDMEGRFGFSKFWSSKLVWETIAKVRALKHDKIVWEEDLCENDIWVLSVDGIHCWVKEPPHEIWSQDRRYLSHKYAKAGLMYELGICLVTSRLLWMRGPFPAGNHDITVARREGLVDELLRRGQKAIADKGYNGEPDAISTPNAHDNKGVSTFKRRAMMRHENFNGLIKRFNIMDTRFRHSHHEFKLAFEAVCVLCQYKVENETPLYDILIAQVKERYDESKSDIINETS